MHVLLRLHNTFQSTSVVHNKKAALLMQPFYLLQGIYERYNQEENRQ